MTADDRPVLVFDVNETLSDLSPLHRAFEELGVPGELARTWFASVLREGFALPESRWDVTDLRLRDG